MKKPVIVASILLFISGMLFAGVADSTKISIAENAKCLQFRIGSNFSLSSFQGSTISYKKHTSENRAYRVGISVSGGMSKELRAYDFYNDADSIHQDDNINNSDFGIAINWQRLKYSRSENTYFYYGYGPNIAYGLDYQKALGEETRETEPEIIEEEGLNIIHGISIGATLLVGVEYFITNSISIHAEYSQGIKYTYQWNKYFYDRIGDITSNTIRKSNAVSLNAGGVRFGCSFYF